ncbi:hypothetical protein EK21DRAFT_80526 [Setomelanomma holmii]|uniref:Uncharacterized protein n=1 Tax=Setomelanomma holmii TaxID=210430 RepID=A0A9P4LFV9_9PLEO|nr:hypothetical protein EK21DRAFT_80526 [Setomelanomma holmii]
MCCVSFIDTLATNLGWLPGNFSIHPDTVSILRFFGLSGLLLCNLWTEHGYWAKMGNQRFMQSNDDGLLESLDICYQYRNGWNSAVSFIHSIVAAKGSVYFCINYPSGTRNRLKTCMETDPDALHRPFFLDTLAADECLKRWQGDIAERRAQLREYELAYDSEHMVFNTATRHLHEMSLQWLSLGQDCMDLHVQLGFLQETHTMFANKLSLNKNGWMVQLRESVHDTFNVLRSQCDICLRWTHVYRARTDNRINLVFHLANQEETNISRKIAVSTARVARETQRDSASMITIAAVTLVFLPGTFICALTSTTFFDFADAGIKVSAKIWILFALTVPLTIAIVGAWNIWKDRRLQMLERERELEESKDTRSENS